MATNTINKILVVDDDEVNLKIVKGLLYKIGVPVECCSSARNALSMAESDKYDIIILDHMMPELSGVEVLKRIKAGKGPNADTYAVILTANVDNGIKEKYYEVGFNEYIAKPLTMDSIDTMFTNYKQYKGEKLAAQNTCDELSGSIILQYLGNNKFDIEAIKVAAKGNIVLLQEMLAMFADKTEDTIKKLESYLVSKEYENYKNTCDNQRTTARSIGATSLYNRLYKHILSVKNEDYDWVDNDFDNMITIWRDCSKVAKDASTL